MKQVITFLVIVFLFNSCKKEEELQSVATILPTPDFYVTVTKNTDNTLSINVKNQSKDADGYVWYLDNQDSVNTFETTYTIERNKTYKVTLKAYNKFGSKIVNRFVDIFSIPTIADFNVIINLDSPNIVRFVNKSMNFDKLTWDFGDGTTSTELNPSHVFSNNLNRKVKLVAENNEKQKGSITIEFPYNQWQSENDCELYLKDLDNFRYVVKKMFPYPGGIHTYSLGPNYNANQLTLKDSIIIENNSSEKTYFIKYYNYNKITSYRKYSTIDLSNFTADLPNFLGTYNFIDRKTEYSSKEPDFYNDTTLSVSFSNGLISIEDNNLQHKFTGYLSSRSTPDKYVFEYPAYRIDNTAFFQEIVFSRITDTIFAEHTSYWSGFGHNSTTIVKYKGYK